MPKLLKRPKNEASDRETFDKTFELRLSSRQRDLLKDKAKKAELSAADLIRHWIETEPVVERQALSDKETVALLREIGGRVKEAYDRIMELGLPGSSELNAETAEAAKNAYQEIVKALIRIP
jgi:gas vesicle protein